MTLYSMWRRRGLVHLKCLLVLMVVFLLIGSSPALAMHESGSCGTPSPEDPFGHQEFVDIGSQFLARNVRIAPQSDGVLVSGEIFNNLQGFFTPPQFKTTLFDADCTYLGANNFSIDNFKFGTTRTFQVVVPGVEFAEVTTYHIEYQGWSSW